MNTSVATYRSGSRLKPPVPGDVRDRRVRRRVALVWGLLMLDVLTFTKGAAILPIPSVVGKGITQGALPLALLLALTVNRRVMIRPNVLLCLMTLLLIELTATLVFATYHVSAVYRTVRLAEFIAVLWLLTPWWGRRDLLLVRCHLTAMGVVLGVQVLGMLVSPGLAVHGRMQGILWPIPSTQLAHYAALTIGMVSVLWLCGRRRGRVTLLVVAIAGVILIRSETRTALVALTVGLVIAGLSLITSESRVRKFFAIGGVVLSVLILTSYSVITTFLDRGQSTQELTNLTGRTKVWGPLLAFPRDKAQEYFGFGLANTGFHGLPIDSNWLAAYWEEGLCGVFICAMVLIFLLVTAYFQPRGVQRALGLLILAYCLVASFTEVQYIDASPYLLDLVVAASLFVPVAGGNQLE